MHTRPAGAHFRRNTRSQKTSERCSGFVSAGGNGPLEGLDFRAILHAVLRLQKTCLAGLIVFSAGHVVWVSEGPRCKGDALLLSVVLAVLPLSLRLPPCWRGGSPARITIVVWVSEGPRFKGDALLLSVVLAVLPVRTGLWQKKL